MITDELPQHLQALARANEIRIARADLKRRIKRREVAAADVIDPAVEILAEAASMPVMELLTAQLHWGINRARKVLVPLSIGEQRSLDSLSSRQRGQLHRALAGGPIADARRLVP